MPVRWWSGQNLRETGGLTRFLVAETGVFDAVGRRWWFEVESYWSRLCFGTLTGRCGRRRRKDVGGESEEGF